MSEEGFTVRRFARRVALLVAPLAIAAFLMGCGPKTEAEHTQLGEKALADHRPEEALAAFRKANEAARAAGARPKPELEERARAAARDEAALALKRAQDLWGAQPKIAADFARRAARLASAELGGDASTAAEAKAFLTEKVEPWTIQHELLEAEAYARTGGHAQPLVAAAEKVAYRLDAKIAAGGDVRRLVEARDLLTQDIALLKTRSPSAYPGLDADMLVRMARIRQALALARSAYPMGSVEQRAAAPAPAPSAAPIASAAPAPAPSAAPIASAPAAAPSAAPLQAAARVTRDDEDPMGDLINREVRR